MAALPIWQTHPDQRPRRGREASSKNRTHPVGKLGTAFPAAKSVNI